MRRWDTLVDRYISSYEARGISSETVRNVTSELQTWGCWLKRRKPRPKIEEITAEQIIQYISSRTTCKSKATTCGVISKIRGMGNFLVEEGYWARNPLRWIRGPKLSPYRRVPRRIGRRKMDALLKTAATSRGDFSRKLWLTVIAMFYGTGLRRGELIRLNIEDYDRDEGFLTVDNRKTGYPHKVPVPSVTAKFLEAWLIERHNKLEACGNLEEPGLFINPSGRRISGAGVSRGLQRLADKSGIGRITCYHFRHSCASDLLESGASLPEVQQVLGHQTICTTMRYTHITDPQRHEAADRHPINQILFNLSEKNNAS